MPARLALCLILTLLAGLPAAAQGFAGMGSTAAEGFSSPGPETRLTFPHDHGPHPDFRIEWWYLTANLTGPDNIDYGVQWTLFRSALAPREAEGWASPQIWMGHAAATTPESHYFAERLARGGIGQAGVDTAPFEAWIDDWRMAGDDDLRKLQLTARGTAFAYDLTLSAQGPLVLHGRNGYSVKSADGQASHYYSQPHYRIAGTLTLPSGPVAVTGQGWLDREWSSQPLAADQSGWDWFSLSFETGARLMGFRLRGARGDFTSGTWIAPDGRATPLAPGAFQADPLEEATVAGRTLPIRWRVTLPERGLDVEVSALNAQSWMDTSFAYWEGPVRVSGSHGGRGYLEMTGYE
ncbi:lipocalin-like domain-containing protein [Antarcticimicrobium luteum]|uniref:Iron ABC transporter permease n=1 Tax=Antarcticimicrobium luteum TaxID=2547397 RepID=A0A4R5V0W1_9RHOB|nr:lipocalin-like domain-containing protein [Antarcticimicrobium luteum]TDK45046.1 iron ABC transporter permease [Antarcticimicrobium luteum]